MDLKKIDPALDLMSEFSKITKGTVGHIHKMRETAIFSEGAVPAKYKALASVLWAIESRCEPCIRYYVQKASELGASEPEFGEFFAVASTMGGCVGEMWALKAYSALKGAKSDQPPTGDPSCCKV